MKGEPIPVVRVLGLASWFSLCFVVSVVLTFPLDGLRPTLIAAGERALGKGRQGPHGTDPALTIGELGMSGLGVKATRVGVQLANSEPEPGPTIDLQSVRVPLLPLLSLLGSSRTVAVELELYDGEASGSVTVDEKQNLVAAEIEIEDVNLGRATALATKLGVPVEGVLSARIDVDMGKQPEKDAAGDVHVEVKGLGLGAGNLKLVPGGFELADGIKLGDLRGHMPIKQGEGTLEALRLEGATDVDAEVTGTLNLKPKLQASRLDAEGWFRPQPAFLDKNPKIKSAIELGEKLSLPGAPSLAKAKDDGGRYHFSARGTLQLLRPQLARDNGRKTKARSSGARPAVDAGAAEAGVKAVPEPVEAVEPPPGD
jgi:type II secretion system protein N